MHLFLLEAITTTNNHVCIVNNSSNNNNSHKYTYIQHIYMYIGKNNSLQ